MNDVVNEFAFTNMGEVISGKGRYAPPVRHQYPPLSGSVATSWLVVGIAGMSIAVTGVGTATNASAASAIRPSLSCVFTEPFDSLIVSPEEVTWVSGGSPQPVNSVSVSAVGEGLNVSGRISRGPFQAKITKEPYTQGEQTEPYTIRVSELTQTNNHGEGSCARFPAGTVHRRVAGVADNDVLNVRSEPKASAKIVAKVDPVGEVWMFPDSARNKWIRVAVQKFPASGTGTVVIVTGWVNSQYVGR